MRRFRWLILGLALAPGLDRPSAAATAPAKVGVGPAYEQLGKLAVMHSGRIKPLDTMAREEVKQIFGRETIKLHDAEGEVTATWGPVAAFFDWSVRPDFWNDQPIILVDYLPLKRRLLAGTIEERLGTIAAKETTSPADRAAAKALLADRSLSSAALSKFARQAKLSAEDRTEIDRLASLLGEDQRWMSARELEGADVAEEGRKVPFEKWFRAAAGRGQRAENDPTGATKLTDVEKRAIEVGTRLVHFQTHRDREIRSIEPLLVMPRPHNPTYLAFTAEVVKKARALGQDGLRERDLPLMELDALKALSMYWHDLPGDDRKVPGVDAKFDAKFAVWLQEKSGWVPLRVLLDAKPELLEQAGYPSRQVVAFLDAFRGLEQAESAAPGTVSQAATTRLVASAQELGAAVNNVTYPSPRAMAREAYYNEANPFWNAQYAYGLALILLAVSLGHSSRGRTLFGKFGLGLYVTGVLALATGIGLEIFGFTMRVLISEWAPVTNMYETVIWVALVTAVLGLVFELIYRRTFAALAAAGVALLGTVLAAKVPLWDSNIKTLEPVLRSNYWLTIHVLTEVSSYAAFALAMGLGLIAIMYYLTATYKRSPSYLELAKPLVPGVPLLALGTGGLAASYGYLGSQWVGGSLFFYTALALWVGGFMLPIMAVVSMLGEVVNRTFFPLAADLDEAALAGNESAAEASSAPSARISEASRAGGVATMAKPTVAEMRARAAQDRPKLDARGLAMQATAAKIKPLSNFIYRTMQVGVLLIAAGTILGGVWADYSWGRFWGWDPKEVWALITLLVYLIPLHGRFAGWVNTFGLVAASIVCFMSVIMAWYGVNFVLGVGLHSYGFTEGGGQGIVTVVVLAVLAVAAGAGWRRSVASRVPSSVA
ncbi:MAG: cytochrome c biogenesis protein CcsA [Singulisphaera sp.]